MKRIGLLGGSFDPIHAGHMQLARDALDRLALDELRFVIAAQPWQKPQVTPARHRVRMLELMLEHLPTALRARLSIERCELARNGPSYTIDTLIELRATLGRDVCLVLVMGGDQWHNLGTWHRHDELLDHASIAVAARPGMTGSPDSALPPPAASPVALDAPHGQTMSFAMTPHPASATAIRDRIARGLPVGDLVDPAVLAYIRGNHLYTGTA